jgi:uncharacterized protein YukJ
LKNDGVLRGAVIDRRRENDDSTPHSQVHVLAGATQFWAAINVQSQAAPSALLFLVDDHFQRPIISRLVDLDPGFTAAPPIH